MGNKRRFLILPNPIQGEKDLHCLLGKITLNYESPLDQSVPNDPNPYIQDFMRGDVKEQAAVIWGTAEEGSLLRSALRPFVELTYDGQSKETYELDTKLILTHSIQNHVTVFKNIWKKHEKEIIAMMDQVAWRFSIFPDKVYMVTGYKSVLDATRTETSSDSKKINGSLDAPIGTAATVPTGGAVPPQTTAQGSMTSEKKTEGGRRGTLVGETVVAVEYHTFKRSWFLSMARRETYGPIYDAGVKLFPGGLAMAGPDTVIGEEESGNDFLLEIEEGDFGRYTLEEGEDFDEEFWVPRSKEAALENNIGGERDTE